MKALAGVAALLLSVACQVDAAEMVVIRAQRMLDVRNGKIVSPATVVIQGTRILAVNPSRAPDGATALDLGDMTLLPGLIDTHVHLTLAFGQQYRLDIIGENSAEAALRSSANARQLLLAGFTTVRDLGQLHLTKDLLAVALSRASDAGLIDAPRIIACGHALTITGGHIDPGMHARFVPSLVPLGPEYGIADGIDEVLKATRYQIKNGAKVIKIAATAGVMSQESSVGAQQYSFEEMRAIVDEATRHGIKVAAHAHGRDGILAAIRAGVASIEHGSMIDNEAIGLMKEHGTYLVPTTYLVDAIDTRSLPAGVREKAETVLPLAKANLQNAIRAGVKIAFGTDVPMVPFADNSKEFGALVARGMTPLAAVRAATLNAADLLGVDDRGEIAAGKLADLTAVEGNPLERIQTLENVRFVMKDGRIFRKP